MTDTVAPRPVEAGASKGLAARLVGVLTSPRATYADIAARPRWLGALAVIVLISAVGITILFSTSVGQRALLDQQVRTMESFGMKVSDAMYQQMQRRVAFSPYFAAIGQIVTLPIMAAVIAGIAIGIFNALLGGDATYKQVFSIVVFSGAVIALQQFFVLPLDYARETLTSPTNLGVFVPMLDENSFVARFLGAIDLFVIWWAISLAIGLGVLYRKRTAPIATTLIVIYASIGLIVAGIKAALA